MLKNYSSNFIHDTWCTKLFLYLSCFKNCPLPLQYCGICSLSLCYFFFSLFLSVLYSYSPHPPPHHPPGPALWVLWSRSKQRIEMWPNCIVLYTWPALWMHGIVQHSVRYPINDIGLSRIESTNIYIFFHVMVCFHVSVLRCGRGHGRGQGQKDIWNFLKMISNIKLLPYWVSLISELYCWGNKN